MAEYGGGIAITGMAGRFPGAPDVGAFWRNLLGGVESIARFDPAELLAAGGDPALVNHPRFVPAEGLLDGIELFDAGFFGYSPREAAVMDPQHRLLLETAWHALEDGGYDPARRSAAVGVFAGAGLSSYLVRNLLPDPDLAGLLGGFSLLIHNDKDFAATTVAHRLGLTGPALAVGTACSSSLVAVHLAAQSLLTHECDAALAGGVSIQVPQRQGYVYSDDGIYSPDGRCRPFDAAAAGTVGGSGVAMVLLRRLDDAVRDGDRIHAVIRATAVNNDGGTAVGYTAPSITGQRAVIAEALALAGTPAATIGYVEAHGTGTQLGDPIEVEALTEAFGLAAARPRSCAIGSVKANVGHLDAAAGVTGLIKAALAVRHGRIPPHPNYDRPNPGIAFEATPFFVNTEPIGWPGGSVPRRAGVSSFGIGGTNAHVVVEQPPSLDRAPGRPVRPYCLLAWSAKSPEALDAAGVALADRVRDRTAAEVADIAYTLAARPVLGHRRAAVYQDGADAAELLAAPAPAPRASGGHSDRGSRPVMFMFPGQGAQHPEMAVGLYRDEPEFRAHFDACAKLLAGHGVELGRLVDPRDRSGAADLLAWPLSGQAGLFAVEYALARTLQAWGVRPAAVIGHSLGEYPAAVLAGALTLSDAVALAVARGRVHERSAPGGMLAVRLGAAELHARLDDGLALAVVNAPDQCVVAGSRPALDRLASALAEAQVPTRLLPGTCAFHSALLDPGLDELVRAGGRVESGAVALPWVSTLTGDWMPAGQPVDPAHWAAQTRRQVRFDAGIRRLLTDMDGAVLLEVGPGSTLSALVRRHPARDPDQIVLATQPRPDGPALAALLGAVGAAWTARADVDLAAVHAVEQPARTDLPGYPFQRTRHWVAAAPQASQANRSSQPLAANDHPIWHGLFPTNGNDDQEGERPSGPAGLDDRPDLRAGLDRLCAALALEYLDRAGLDTAPGARHERADLAERLRILPPYRRFLDYLLAILEQDRLLDRDGGPGGRTVTFRTEPRPPSSEVLAAGLLRVHPDAAGLVAVVRHCAQRYDSALTVPGAGLDVLYPDGTGDLLSAALGASTLEFGRIGPLVDCVAELVRRCAAGSRPLRVLEVGAGGGRLTWPVAEALASAVPDAPAPQAQFTVTDIGRAFTEYLAGEAARRGVPIRTAVLDIGRPAGEQGFGGQRFDLVVGLDVLHAAPDVPAALGHLTELLASGGRLALVETVATDRWLSMVWGLSADWWAFADGLRDRTPLLRPDQWKRALAGTGLAATAVLPDTGDPATAGAVLLLGEAVATSSRAAFDDLPTKRPDLADWTYLPGWRRAAPIRPDPPAPGASCMAFVDEGPLATAVADRLAGYGLDVVQVRPGDVADPADYRRLVGRLVAGGRERPRYVVHLWNTSEPGPAGERLARLDADLRRGLFSLLALAPALAGSGTGGGPVRLLAVTSHAEDVLGGDLRAPDRATMRAATKVIPLEYPRLAGSCLDVETPGDAEHADWLADRIVAELLTAPAEPNAAYRGRTRWVPGHQPVRLAPAHESTPRLRPGGTYLICGGLGGIGLGLAEHLGRLPAKVALVRRTPFPARDQWPAWLAEHPATDPTGAQIRRLTAIETAGGEVLVLAADVTDLDRMRAAVAATVDRFGPITGVVHAAGVTDAAGVIERRSAADTWAAIAAKVRGPLVLTAALADAPPEFTVFCSSIGTLLPKLKSGEVGYLAGNEFLDAYAAATWSGSDPGALTISWTDWLEAGMWARARQRLDERFRSPADDLLRGITTAEGVELFDRILAARPGPHVVVSTQDLDALLARHAAASGQERLGAPEVRATSEAPPRNPVERAVAEIWRSLLGLDAVGVHDDFFELGGDSLLALRFLARMRDELDIDRSIADLYETPTIAGLLAAQSEPREAEPAPVASEVTG